MSATQARAQHLSERQYTVSDGLPSNNIFCIHRDLSGYLWFCSSEGLARFDGLSFQVFGVAEGLPTPGVYGLLQMRDAKFLVATDKGLCRFNPYRLPNSTESRFTCWPIRQGGPGIQVGKIFQDRGGRIWLGTSAGLYELADQSRVVPVRLDDASHQSPLATDIGPLAEDQYGTLWIGTSQGLCRRWPDGTVVRYRLHSGLYDNVWALAEDAGLVWAATEYGLYAIRPESKRAVMHKYSQADGLPSRNVNSLYRSGDGEFWVGTSHGLCRRINTSTGRVRFEPYTIRPGSPVTGVLGFAEDTVGALWMVLQEVGVVRLGRDGATTYHLNGGLMGSWARDVLWDSDGSLIAVTGDMRLARFDGRAFTTPVRPDFEIEKERSWGHSQLVVRDHTGRWWFPGPEGLLRFPPVRNFKELSRTPPDRQYTKADGLAGNVVLRIFEDSRGDIWVGTEQGLSHWERSTDRLHSFSRAEGMPDVSGHVGPMPHSFAEDHHGRVWIGFYPGGLARFENGRLTAFGTADGLPDGPILALYVDHAGRLWVGSSREGLAQLDDTDSQTPRWVRYTTRQGLSSNRVFSIVEDLAGRVYCGTSKGVDRIDVVSGRIRHYDEADGLPVARAESAYRDPTGALWFGTGMGLARLVPDIAQPDRPPSPLIRSLRIAGKLRPVADLGAVTMDGLSLAPQENSLQIEYASLRVRPRQRMLYQLRLGENQKWSEPTEDQVIHYARLGAGSYRFEVRSLSPEGVPSATSATVSFRIAPPVWLRWWFLSAAALLSGGLLYGLYRFRLAQALALERIRAHLARDLHDEVGSGLAEIAIASEVAGRNAGQTGTDRLSQIAERCRELRSSMADIVWAVDPSKDSVSDLLGRLRQTAVNLLEPAGCGLEFRAGQSVETASIALRPEARRHVLLATKEALTNVVRHSGATHVKLHIVLENGMLCLNITDNGRGFDQSVPPRGNGLRNMARRFAEVHGSLALHSEPGRGVSVLLRVPLGAKTARDRKIRTA